MQFGIDRLVDDTALRAPLHGRRLALLGHPASVTEDLRHSLDVLVAMPDLTVTAAFGPQHGMRGDKQDNMVETADETDPVHGIPVFSLYGDVRRLTPAMLDSFDILLVDLQDVGCRIYTYLTTLCYALEDCARAGKPVWVLDRPNPAGRPVDGLILQAGFESFVGVGPVPMRHGLTPGEAARWYRDHAKLNVDLTVIRLDGYRPGAEPGFGWPSTRAWVNPSPNLATVNAARCYSGTVLLEGTKLSEGRGTTRPLELLGAPGLDIGRVIGWMHDAAPAWLAGCLLRPCYFEPMFHKHAGTRCAGFQIHTDHPSYRHRDFHPFRLVSLALKAIRALYPDCDLWRDFPYEYTTGRLPIDTINGGPRLRDWVDDPHAGTGDLEALLRSDEAAWTAGSAAFRVY